MITPIIMESNLAVVTAKMLALKERKVDRVHIDIGDGLFSDLLTISPADLQEVDTAKMKMDIHLLVDDPLEWVEECVALKPQRIFGQIEHMGSQKLFTETVEGYDVIAGLALKLETPIEAIEEDMLKKVKAILLLEIPPGTTGSPFDNKVLGKLEELRKIYKGEIVMDGGINPETYQLVMSCGASEAGANSAYWRGDFDEKN